MTTPDQIAAEIAEKAAKAATPGPWEIERIGCYQYEDHLVGAEIVGRNRGTMVAEIRGAIEIYGKRHSENAANAELIAAANPSAILSLLSAHRAALEKVDALTQALQIIANQGTTTELRNEPEVDYTLLDFDGAYDYCINTARTTLTEAP
jgi:hypothetical protein